MATVVDYVRDELGILVGFPNRRKNGVEGTKERTGIEDPVSLLSPCERRAASMEGHSV